MWDLPVRASNSLPFTLKLGWVIRWHLVRAGVKVLLQCLAWISYYFNFFGNYFVKSFPFRGK